MATLVVVHQDAAHIENNKVISYLLAIPVLTVGVTIISICLQKTSKTQVNLPKNNPKNLRKTAKVSTIKKINSHPTDEDDISCNFCGKNDFVSYGRLLTHIEFKHKDQIQNDDDEDDFTENNEKHTEVEPNKSQLRSPTRQHQAKIKQINVGRPSVPKINIEDISETDSDTITSNGTVL